MKKIILVFMLLPLMAKAQVENYHVGKVIDNYLIGSNEITVVKDQLTNCILKTSLHSPNSFYSDEIVSILKKPNSQLMEIIKPSLNEKVYVFSECANSENMEHERTEFTLSEIIKVGQLHNSILESVFSKYTTEYEDADLKNDMEIIPVADLPMSLRTDVLENEPLAFEYLQKNLNDPISFNYCSIIKQIIHDCVEISQLRIELDAISNIIKLDQRNFNKSAPLVFIEVSKKSAIFWTSSKGIKVLGDTDSEPAPLSPWVKGLIVADGLGAAGAFVGYGLLAGITGPMGWAGLVAIVGFSAAWSSAMYALV